MTIVWVETLLYDEVRDTRATVNGTEQPTEAPKSLICPEKGPQSVGGGVLFAWWPRTSRHPESFTSRLLWGERCWTASGVVWEQCMI